MVLPSIHVFPARDQGSGNEARLNMYILTWIIQNSPCQEARSKQRRGPRVGWLHLGPKALSKNYNGKPCCRACFHYSTSLSPPGVLSYQ
eukprot:scaffold173679_cov19-Tisochrysis_lutea.AAC.1